MQTVGDGFVHQRMVGNADLAGQILGAGRLIGKNCREQIVRPHALDRRRHFVPAVEAQHRERSRRIPAPARSEHRRGQQSLCQHVLDRRRPQEVEYHLERKRVLLAE